MKLLVDDRWLRYGGGIGKYAEKVLSLMPEDFAKIAFLGSEAPINDPLSPIKLTMKIKRLKGDCFWSPGFMPPAFPGIPYIVTIHDLIHLELGTKLHRFYYHRIIGPLAKNAACIFTVSEFSRMQIAEFLHIDPEKIIAIYNGVDSIYQPSGDRHQEVEPYIFYIGNHRSAKNIDRMIEGYSRSSAKDDFLFLFSGNEAPLIKALAEKYGVANRIRFTGFIPEERLPEFYRGATALMYVSLNEGFGLPNIEAIACGTPVVTSNLAAMPEIVGDGAIFVDPYDVHAIADGIVRCIEYSVDRAAILDASRKVKAKYTWEKTAQRSWENMAKYFK
jgi:glycosyltransferase involved in cell wall biosynthesis